MAEQKRRVRLTGWNIAPHRSHARRWGLRAWAWRWRSHLAHRPQTSGSSGSTSSRPHVTQRMSGGYARPGGLAARRGTLRLLRCPPGAASQMGGLVAAAVAALGAFYFNSVTTATSTPSGHI